MYKPYATEADFCKACSPYQVGNVVFLLKEIKTSEGVFEKGTLLVVSAIELNNATIPEVVKGKEIEYEINENAFKYRMMLCDSGEEIMDMYFHPRCFARLEKEMCEELAEEDFKKAAQKKKEARVLTFDDVIVSFLVIVIMACVSYPIFSIIINGFEESMADDVLQWGLLGIFLIGLVFLFVEPLIGDYKFKLKEKKKK